MQPLVLRKYTRLLLPANEPFASVFPSLLARNADLPHQDLTSRLPACSYTSACNP
jgi:hypothetical protein